MAKSATGESVLSRAVRIFDAFTPDERVLSVSQIARRARLHLATASRLISQLESHGLLDREPDRRLRVGVRMRELALRATPAPDLRNASTPFMADAHAVLGHHVQLAVLDGDEVLFVERLSAPGAVINHTRIAERLPLHASSSGLVLLAFGSGDLRERILAEPLRRYTARTLTDAAALRTALAEVRGQGYAYLPGHVHEDAVGVAVPIRLPAQHDARSVAVAALAAIVPVGTEAKIVVGVLSTAARGIGRTLEKPLDFRKIYRYRELRFVICPHPPMAWSSLLGWG
jgi:DNA-binding IclR family transcriptional regulator